MKAKLLKHAFWIALALRLLIIGFKCGRCSRPQPPPIEKKKVDNTIIEVRKAAQILKDSVSRLNDYLAKSKERESSLLENREKLLAEISKQKNKSIPLIERLRYDTAQETLENCNELLANFDNYIRISDMEIKNCDSNLVEKDNQIEILERTKKLLTDLAIQYGGGFEQMVAEYNKLYKAYKPRNQFYFGLTGMAGNGLPVYAGGSLMLKTKKNFIFESGAMIGEKGMPYYFGSMKFLIRLRK